MEANMFGILFEAEKSIYLSKKQIIVPFFQLGRAKGSEIGLGRPFEEFDFRYLRLLNRIGLVVASSAPGFSVGSTLAKTLNDYEADNRILAIRPDDAIDLLQVYDIYPRNEMQDYCCYGDLIAKMTERMTASRA